MIGTGASKAKAGGYDDDAPLPCAPPPDMLPGGGGMKGGGKGRGAAAAARSRNANGGRQMPHGYWDNNLGYQPAEPEKKGEPEKMIVIFPAAGVAYHTKPEHHTRGLKTEFI